MGKTFSYFFLLEVAIVILQQAAWHVLLPVGRGGGAHREGIGNEEKRKTKVGCAKSCTFACVIIDVTFHLTNILIKWMT